MVIIPDLQTEMIKAFAVGDETSNNTTEWIKYNFAKRDTITQYLSSKYLYIALL